MAPTTPEAVQQHNNVIRTARLRIVELKQAGRFVRAWEMAQGVEIEIRTHNFSKSTSTSFEIIPWK